MHTGKWLALAAVTMLLMADAAAQGIERPMRDRRGPGPQRMMQDTRPNQFAPEGNQVARHRMTPEERRQLRQDVHDAGRDLYPERMRDRRREMRRGE